MAPSLQIMSGTGINLEQHAHLLAVEVGGQCGRETPDEVIEEVAFRATHVSSLMEEMLRDAKRHDRLDVDQV